MRILGSLFIIVFGSLIAGAIFTPPIYSFLDANWAGLPWPYSRVFNRVTMLLVIPFVYFLRKQFQLDKALIELKKLMVDKKGSALEIFSGMSISIFFSLAMIPLFVATGAFIYDDFTNGELIQKFLKAVPAGLAIGLIEESFFRVLMLVALIVSLGRFVGILVTSLVYASVHFIAPVNSWVYTGFSFTIGFDYLRAVSEQAFQIDVLFPFIGLTILGVVLACLYLRYRSFGLCIGLHAGWVVSMKVCNYVTSPAGDGKSKLAERMVLVGEPVAWLSVIVVGVIAWMYQGRKERAVAN